jgi:hypothetical protein
MVIRYDISLVVSFKHKPPRVQDVLLHKSSNTICVVMDINDYHGIVWVQYQNGKRKRYTTRGGSDFLFRYLTKEEFADYRLLQANSRSDDSWRES